MALATIDQRHGLVPWTYDEHKAFIAGRYGEILGTNGKEAADDYIEIYQQKEKLDDEAYETQRELLRTSSQTHGGVAQELPDKVKLAWDPRPLFAPVKEEKPKKKAKDDAPAEVTPE